MALQGAARHLLSSFASSSSRMFGGAAVNSGLPSLLFGNGENSTVMSSDDASEHFPCKSEMCEQDVCESPSLLAY